MSVKIFVNHIGFLCASKKTFVVEDCSANRFEIQDMNQVEAEALGAYENWKTIYKGNLEPSSSHMGTFLTGDFSGLITPGIYRIVIPEVDGRSFQFAISDGAFHFLPRLFLDFVHDWRSGDFENEFRGPSHLDDALRSDTGEQIDVSGGWYDAGDLRKWMTTANMPALGFLYYYENMHPDWNHYNNEEIINNDLITETIWGIKFILKMQDQKTGMFYEEVGGGGYGRRLEGMTWWYENHSGCLADNSQNHFTDNIPNSGDERLVRVEYNPIVQYISITILLRAANHIRRYDSEMADHCVKSANSAWNFVIEKAPNDPMHRWTATISWQLLAAIEMQKMNLIERDVVNFFLNELVILQDKDLGFWYMDQNKKDPYRGILHSAQPLIALAEYLSRYPDSEFTHSVIHSFNVCWDKYIQKMTTTNPFGIMPYGTWYDKATEEDHFRKLDDKLLFRFYMPDRSKQRINHGLGGHWSGWAHAMTLIGKLTEDKKWIEAAWNQLYWLLGANLGNSCLVSGVGYNNPMPHSRFLGTLRGGFSVGPRGDRYDEFVLDLDRRAEWNTTEYWNIPLANTMMALAELLPKEIVTDRKIGAIHNE